VDEPLSHATVAYVKIHASILSFFDKPKPVSKTGFLALYFCSLDVYKAAHRILESWRAPIKSYSLPKFGRLVY
jgi:hypothetical protein